MQTDDSESTEITFYYLIFKYYLEVLSLKENAQILFKMLIFICHLEDIINKVFQNPSAFLCCVTETVTGHLQQK